MGLRLGGLFRGTVAVVVMVLWVVIRFHNSNFSLLCFLGPINCCINPVLHDYYKVRERM